MISLENKEMFNVVGGASLGSSMINAITKAVNTIYSIGQSIGSSIRRITSGSYCSY